MAVEAVLWQDGRGDAVRPLKGRDSKQSNDEQMNIRMTNIEVLGGMNRRNGESECLKRF